MAETDKHAEPGALNWYIIRLANDGGTDIVSAHEWEYSTVDGTLVFYAFESRKTVAQYSANSWKSVNDAAHLEAQAD